MNLFLKRKKDDWVTLIKANEQMVLKAMQDAYRLCIENPDVFYIVYISEGGGVLISRQRTTKSLSYDTKGQKYKQVKIYHSKNISRFSSDEIFVEDCFLYIMKNSERVAFENAVEKQMKLKGRELFPEEKANIIIEQFPLIKKLYDEQMLPLQLDFYNSIVLRRDLQEAISFINMEIKREKRFEKFGMDIWY